ncbi:MAG: hypothetical protein ACOCRK_09720 [bacterium]
MKKIFTLIMVISMAVVFGISAMAIESDYMQGSGDIEINIGDVVFLEMTSDEYTGSAFTNEDVENGYVLFEDVHSLNIDAATNYDLWANIQHSHAKFEDDQRELYNSDRDYTLNGAANDVYDDGTPFRNDGEDQVAEGIFSNFFYAKATGPETAAVFDWKRVDHIGSLDHNSNKWRRLASGSQTLGTDGDDYNVDFKLDFTAEYDMRGNAEFEVPSGVYTITANYVVIEN